MTPSSSTVGLKKSVKLIDLVTLGAGTAIGASIFSILGPSSVVAGSGILVTTLLAAIPMSIFGLIYAFMSSAYPRSGASYEWQRTFVHPMLGFVVVWLRIMGTALILNVMGNVLINYLSAMVSLPVPGRLVVFGFFTAVFVLNYVGVAVAARARDRRHDPAAAHLRHLRRGERPRHQALAYRQSAGGWRASDHRGAAAHDPSFHGDRDLHRGRRGGRECRAPHPARPAHRALPVRGRLSPDRLHRARPDRTDRARREQGTVAFCGAGLAWSLGAAR